MRWLTLVTVFLVVSSDNLIADETPKKIKPVVVWSGKDSGVAKETFNRCQSDKEWSATWDAHQNEGGQAGQPSPTIDFDSHMVIALFQGKGSQNWGLFIHEIQDERDRLRIRFITGYYQTASIPESETDRLKLQTQSYAIVVLPKCDKEVVFEEATDRDAERRPSKWKERGKLKPVNAK